MKQGWPRKISIHEVVLRDGIQNERKLVPTEEKLRLIRELVACGVRRIEVSSFVNRSLVPQMADAEALWERIERKKGVLYSALILSEGGLERAIHCRVPHVGIFVSASDTHSLKNSNKNVSEALKEAVRLIGLARDAGMKVRAGVMNAFGCAYEGNVPVTRVLKLVRAFMKRGPDEICLADSSGLANPVQMEEVLTRVRHETADTDLSLHLHNTRGQGLANVYAALRQGVSVFDTSMGGLGGCPFITGAKGNIATEDTVGMLHEMGLKTGIDLDCLCKASLRFEGVMGQIFPVVLSHLKQLDCGPFPFPD
ncbi:MAG TPA: hydroxymethylglutaryl-CoA lyase [Syntrophales bacterium]|nr:hydroxymethylglutaryl-CoA lyase [Syntrophales bacterium]